MEKEVDKYFLGIDERFVKVVIMNIKIPERYKMIIFELINTACDIQINKNLTKEDLEIFEKGFRQSWELIWYDCSGRFIAQLAYYFSDAEALLLKLWVDKSAKNRQKIVALIGKMPSAIHERIFKEALFDRSKEIRGSVAFKICTPMYMQFLPLLDEYLQSETDDKIKSWIISRYKIFKKSNPNATDLKYLNNSIKPTASL